MAPRTLCLVASLAAGLGAAQVALAQSPTARPQSAAARADAGEWRRCSSPDPVERIAGCNRVLSGAGETGENRAIAHRNRGNALRLIGELNAAQADLARAIELDPRVVAAHVDRGALLLELGDVDRADLDFERALKLAPGNAEAMLGRAAVLERRGQPLAALAMLDRLIAIAPRYARAYASRANLLARQRQTDRALADAETAVQLAPDDAWPIEVRGLVHRLREEPAKAKADFDRLIALQPGSPHGYVQRAGVLGDLRQLEAAIADYSTALEVQPRSPFALSGRAWCRYLAGDIHGAIVDASAAIALNDTIAAAWDTRGHALLTHGERKLALADFNAALQRDDGLRGAYVGRARIHIAERRLGEAIADLERALSIPPGGIDDREAGDEAARLLTELRDPRIGPLPGGRPTAPAGSSQPADLSAAPAPVLAPPALGPGAAAGRPEPPIWSTARSATECRLTAQWPDRAIVLFARTGLLGTAPGLQIGIGLDTGAARVKAGAQVASRLASGAGAVAAIDLSRLTVVHGHAPAPGDQRGLVSIGPLQLDAVRRDIDERDTAVLDIDGQPIAYPLGDLAFWLPALEQCALSLPRDAPAGPEQR